MLESKKEIAFLGSSITAQKEGYVFELQKRFSNDTNFIAYGYGGISINPCKLDLAFSTKPNIIVFDWFILFK
jgi:hypothetical protein